jgi:hypothetical protein
MFLLLATVGYGQDDKKPDSKVYISDTQGEATVIVQEGRKQDVAKREVYTAEGLIFETQKKSNQAFVLSNGSGVYMDEVSRLEIKKFVQEPFRPDRTDLEVEPSISRTNGFIPHGYVAICTPKIVAGSSMTYSTAFGEVRLSNNKLALNVKDDETVVLAIEGDITVTTGPNTFETLKSGHKATLSKRGIKIEEPSKEEMNFAVDKVTTACKARREVFFETLKRIETNAAKAKEEIVATPVVPAKLPTEFTISPARIP